MQFKNEYKQKPSEKYHIRNILRYFKFYCRKRKSLVELANRITKYIIISADIKRKIVLHAINSNASTNTNVCLYIFFSKKI